MNLVCGSSHFTLAVMPLDEYPLLPAQPKGIGAIDSSTLSQAVSQVSIAASRDDTLPLLTGVRIEINGPAITLLATDRYRLAMRELDWEPADTSIEEVALVKARILQDVAKSMTSGAKVEVGLSSESQPGASSLVDSPPRAAAPPPRSWTATTPPVRRLFPESTPIQAVVDRHALLEAVKRMSLVAERKTSVRLAFTDGQLVLEAGQGATLRLRSHRGNPARRRYFDRVQPAVPHRRPAGPGHRLRALRLHASHEAGRYHRPDEG